MDAMATLADPVGAFDGRVTQTAAVAMCEHFSLHAET